MSITEQFARFLVRVVVRSTAEQDIITDYLDEDVPDYRGAWRAFLATRPRLRRIVGDKAASESFAALAANMQTDTTTLTVALQRYAVEARLVQLSGGLTIERIEPPPLDPICPECSRRKPPARWGIEAGVCNDCSIDRDKREGRA